MTLDLREAPPRRVGAAFIHWSDHSAIGSREPLPEAAAQTSVWRKGAVAMRKFLLPTDGSASSLRAAEFLVRFLAGQPAAVVHVLHVHSPVMAWEISPHVTAEMVRQIHEKAGHEAVKGARSVLDAAGIRHEEHLLSGDPAQTIASLAAEERVDGIVMGTRGVGPLKSLVLGSVATKVVHLADVPVTLVK